ncbi:MAG: D-alanyl-D-alanine carboxypeptidase family protein [Fimbriimonadia bacterium]|nr:D-alanyl-D-alanine carboxypeptidase family protein [Fimbriimonadia bacterium]
MPPKQGAPEPIAALNRIPIQECGEPMVDLRLVCPQIALRDEKKLVPFLRAGVTQMLNEAASRLPDGWQLKVLSAWRALQDQKEIYDHYYEQLRADHPNWNRATLRRQTNHFFAPYDQPAPPGHCTGGAVDVGLIKPDGTDADLRSPFEGWKAAYTYRAGLAPEAHFNRHLLLRVMTEAGFSNCRDEFWHFSYGDSAWAVRIGAPLAIYGLVEGPFAALGENEG